MIIDVEKRSCDAKTKVRFTQKGIYKKQCFQLQIEKKTKLISG